MSSDAEKKAEVERFAVLAEWAPQMNKVGMLIADDKSEWDAIIAKHGSSLKYAIVVSWATWCGPCKLKLPKLIELAKAMRSLAKKDKEMVFIMVESKPGATLLPQVLPDWPKHLGFPTLCLVSVDKTTRELKIVSRPGHRFEMKQDRSRVLIEDPKLCGIAGQTITQMLADMEMLAPGIIKNVYELSVLPEMVKNEVWNDGVPQMKQMAQAMETQFKNNGSNPVSGHQHSASCGHHPNNNNAAGAGAKALPVKPLVEPDAKTALESYRNWASTRDLSQEQETTWVYELSESTDDVTQAVFDFVSKMMTEYKIPWLGKNNVQGAKYFLPEVRLVVHNRKDGRKKEFKHRGTEAVLFLKQYCEALDKLTAGPAVTASPAAVKPATPASSATTTTEKKG